MKFCSVLLVLLFMTFGQVLCNDCDSWMLRQITRDFDYFSQSDFKHEALVAYINQHSDGFLVHFLLKDGQVQILHITQRAIKCPLRVDRIKDFLVNLIRCYRVPEVDFLVDVGDGYVASDITAPVPLFVFSKNKFCNKGLVLIPDSTCVAKAVALQKLIISCNHKIPFDKRIDKLIWRGTVTGCGWNSGYIDLYLQSARCRLVALSLQHFELIDAKFSRFGQAPRAFRDVLKRLGYVGDFMPRASHQRYKYQVLVDGNTTSWTRAYWQLLSASLMFKQDSDNIQWYYEALKSYEHYVPVKVDMSDLVEQIKWARAHEESVKQIIKNANSFAKKNLNYQSMLRYMYFVLMMYAQKYKVGEELVLMRHCAT